MRITCAGSAPGKVSRRLYDFSFSQRPAMMQNGQRVRDATSENMHFFFAFAVGGKVLLQKVKTLVVSPGDNTQCIIMPALFDPDGYYTFAVKMPVVPVQTKAEVTHNGAHADSGGGDTLWDVVRAQDSAVNADEEEFVDMYVHGPVRQRHSPRVGGCGDRLPSRRAAW